MRIKEDSYGGHELYSGEWQERVSAAVQHTSHITEIKQLLAEISREAVSLRRLFWTEAELREKQETADFFDARMQATVFYTLMNMEKYQHFGWQELIYEGEMNDEGVNSVPEEK
jgi:hypothetical protein